MNLPVQSQPVARNLRNAQGNSLIYPYSMGLGINASAFCTCKNGSVDVNKCGINQKPKCDGDSCDCVQK
jgi:hypothetical protein